MSTVGVMSADEGGKAVMAAAERFCASHGASLTSTRLLYEFLAFPGPNGMTLSGLSTSATEAQLLDFAADVVAITRKFVGYHIIKHYYVMRQYHEASDVVRAFLQFLGSETNLPDTFKTFIGEAIEVAEDACEQLPHIMRIIRQPDVLNEAFAFCYQSRPWPLSHVPQTTEVKTSSSRRWPAGGGQHFHAWISFASERCRVEPADLEELLEKIPANLSVASRIEACWEVMSVSCEHQISFQEWKGDRKITVQFSEKRAADFQPGMVMSAAAVTLSDGYTFLTDWGYVYPTFYTPYLSGKGDFAAYDDLQLLY